MLILVTLGLVFPVPSSEAEITVDLVWRKTSGFPVDGVFWAVAVDPSDSSRLYAGVENLGLLMSRDGGRSWERHDPGHHWIRGIVLDPLDKNIGYYLFGGGLVIFDRQVGKPQGSDFGTGAGYGFRASSIAMDASGRTIYVGSVQGVFKILERDIKRGITYEKISQGLPDSTTYSTIAVDPFNPDVLYVGTRGAWKYEDRLPEGYAGMGIYKSTDGGKTWKPSSKGLTNLDVNRILIHPKDASRIYAATFGGVYQSTDAGNSWAAINQGLPNLEVWALVTDPRGPDKMFAGTWGGGLFSTSDGGNLWEKTGFNGIDFHRDHIFSLMFDPNNVSTLYIGTGDGLFKYNTQNKFFSHVTGSLFHTNAWYIAIDSSDPSVIYAFEGGVAGGRDLYRSDDGGKSWKFIGPHKPLELLRHTYGMVIAVHPRSTDTVYYTSAAGLYKSLDRGETWKKIEMGPLGEGFHIHGIGIPKKNPSILYAGTGTGKDKRGEFSRSHMLKSEDGGEKWVLINNGLPEKNTHIYTVLVHPDNPDIVYMGTMKHGFGCAPHDGYPICESMGIYKTVDGGRKWLAVNEGLDDLNAHALAYHPENLNVVYAGAGDGVYVSEDGAAWKRLTAFGQGTIVTSIVLDPRMPNVIFVSLSGERPAGVGKGVYVSLDSGKTWGAVNAGLERLDVENLAMNPGGGTIYAAAGGVYKATYRIVEVREQTVTERKTETRTLTETITQTARMVETAVEEKEVTVTSTVVEKVARAFYEDNAVLIMVLLSVLVSAYLLAKFKRRL